MFSLNVLDVRPDEEKPDYCKGHSYICDYLSLAPNAETALEKLYCSYPAFLRDNVKVICRELPDNLDEYGKYSAWGCTV